MTRFWPMFLALLVAALTSGCPAAEEDTSVVCTIEPAEFTVSAGETVTLTGTCTNDRF
mgnify:CR=1 FL=1